MARWILASPVLDNLNGGSAWLKMKALSFTLASSEKTRQKLYSTIAISIGLKLVPAKSLQYHRSIALNTSTSARFTRQHVE